VLQVVEQVWPGVLLEPQLKGLALATLTGALEHTAQWKMGHNLLCTYCMRLDTTSAMAAHVHVCGGWKPQAASCNCGPKWRAGAEPAAIYMRGLGPSNACQALFCWEELKVRDDKSLLWCPHQ